MNWISVITMLASFLKTDTTISIQTTLLLQPIVPIAKIGSTRTRPPVRRKCLKVVRGRGGRGWAI